LLTHLPLPTYLSAQLLWTANPEDERTLIQRTLVTVYQSTCHNIPGDLNSPTVTSLSVTFSSFFSPLLHIHIQYAHYLCDKKSQALVFFHLMSQYFLLNNLNPDIRLFTFSDNANAYDLQITISIVSTIYQTSHTQEHRVRKDSITIQKGHSYTAQFLNGYY